MSALLALSIVVIVLAFIVLVSRLCRIVPACARLRRRCCRDRRYVAQTLDDEERMFANRYGVQLDQFEQIDEENGLPDDILPHVGVVFSEGDEVIEFDVAEFDSQQHVKKSPYPQGSSTSGGSVLTISGAHDSEHSNISAQHESEIELMNEMAASRHPKSFSSTAEASAASPSIPSHSPVENIERIERPSRSAPSRQGRKRAQANSASTPQEASTTVPDSNALDNVSDSEFDANPNLRISSAELEEEYRRMQQEPNCEGDELIPL